MTTQHQKSEDSQVEIGSKNLCVALKLRYNKNGRVNTRLFCLGIKISNGMLLQGERDSIVVNFVDVFARVVIFTQDIIVCLEWLPFSFCFFFFFFFFLWQGQEFVIVEFHNNMKCVISQVNGLKTHGKTERAHTRNAHSDKRCFMFFLTRMTNTSVEQHATLLLL